MLPPPRVEHRTNRGPAVRWQCPTCRITLGRCKGATDQTRMLYPKPGLAAVAPRPEPYRWTLTCIHGHVTVWPGLGIKWTHDHEREDQAA